MIQTITAKFGGTSMGSANAMQSVTAIVKAMKVQPVVVVSAVSGTTDGLIALAKTASVGGDWRSAFEAIKQKHEKIVSDLETAVDLNLFWTDLEHICEGLSMLRELSLATLDRVQSFGERLSATILAHYLDAHGTSARMVDARELVFTDANFGAGEVDFVKTNVTTMEILTPMLEQKIIPIITGFIGQAPTGQYITLGRGGSDYSGAIVGAALHSEEVQIWTDVEGIFNADPRVIPSARSLEQLSFHEAGELAYFGAKVLHPKTIKPAIEQNIPVRILNTFKPEATGTVITSEERQSLKSVTSKKNIAVVNICSLGMLNAHGFLARIFDVFAKHNVIVDVVSTSEVSVSVTVDQPVPPALLDDIRAFSIVNVVDNMAIVCLVGEGIRTQPDVLGRLFSCVSPHPVSMVSQGSSKRNITFLVAQGEAGEVVKSVFGEFFSVL